VNGWARTVFRSALTAWMYEDTERAQTVRKGFLARVPKGRLGEPGRSRGAAAFPSPPRRSDFLYGHILYATAATRRGKGHGESALSPSIARAPWGSRHRAGGCARRPDVDLRFVRGYRWRRQRSAILTNLGDDLGDDPTGAVDASPQAESWPCGGATPTTWSRRCWKICR